MNLAEINKARAQGTQKVLTPMVGKHVCIVGGRYKGETGVVKDAWKQAAVDADSDREILYTLRLDNGARVRVDRKFVKLSSRVPKKEHEYRDEISDLSAPPLQDL